MVYSQGNSGSHYNKEGGNRGSNNNFHANAPAPPININIELYEGNDKSKIRLDLFDTQAEKHAKGIIDERKNKINQIRIFYNQFIVLNEKINNSEENFRRQLPYIKMIKARVKYSKGRKNIGDYFENFLLKCVDKVNTLEDFKIICSFFETVVGYATYYDKENNHAQ
ncbi:MAG: type III-A CRISPR-associated protein Csm2 [Deltaproteobacteria bacterium]|jgi:CRISPR-associated protein Csm2|uniref:CRISPR system Cms protein Csm2 n=1 Tax=Candidatus Acidulodesulfobacterium acidiphilum TaxID=2597224 RepID=A0A520XE95_9DELT|nr:type III-A CRISPR-associated protein Csm2 [Deltaproteobacteria bacterium]RZV39478.1 MAG: type III-A CRISPR-associated protein Csm2 [Candidatus Acidulodesulfobacterium acidiphilum]